MRVTYSARARTDLAEIGEYIARHSAERAESFTAELITACSLIADLPFGYPLLKPQQAASIRRKPHGQYLIFYRVLEGRIDILRILHGARDVDRLLAAFQPR